MLRDRRKTSIPPKLVILSCSSELKTTTLTTDLMSYENAVERMYSLGHELAQTPSHKFDLAHMRVLLAALNHPE
jgi:hypothetical protein